MARHTANTALWLFPRAENYAMGVERAGWGRWFVRFFRWKPSTYAQVWLFAVLGFGVPGLIIWSVVGHNPLSSAIPYGAGVTFAGGLAQSWQLNRRRQRGL